VSRSIPPSRVAVLRQIAVLYPDLVCPLNGGSGIPGDGDAVGLMPPTYTPTVREFERLLARMRHISDQVGRFHGYRLKTLAFHLEGWHTTAERVVRLRPVMRENRRGRLVQARDHEGNVDMRRVPEFRRHPDALLDRAELALLWMAEQWRLGHEPMLPDQVIEELSVAA
jgi:hypothetical protein